MKPFITASILFSLILLLFSCEEDVANVELFEPGTLEATSTNTSIVAGETVTFTDNSTKVYERTWTFTGGTPETSSDPQVTVTYERGGTFSAQLQVKYVDNQIERKEFTVEVEGVVLANFGIYTEDGAVTPGSNITLVENNAYNIATIATDPYEGAEALRFQFDAQDTWGVMGTIKPEGGAVDISEFADGFYNVALKTTCSKIMLIMLQGGGQNGIVTLDPSQEPYGFKRDGAWHLLSIPIADFLSNNPELDLTAISDLLVLRSGESSVTSTEDWDFYVDNFYLSK